MQLSKATFELLALSQNRAYLKHLHSFKTPYIRLVVIEYDINSYLPCCANEPYHVNVEKYRFPIPFASSATQQVNTFRLSIHYIVIYQALFTMAYSLPPKAVPLSTIFSVSTSTRFLGFSTTESYLTKLRNFHTCRPIQHSAVEKLKNLVDVYTELLLLVFVTESAIFYCQPFKKSTAVCAYSTNETVFTTSATGAPLLCVLLQHQRRLEGYYLGKKSLRKQFTSSKQMPSPLDLRDPQIFHSHFFTAERD